MSSIISSALAGMNVAQNKFVKSASLVTQAPFEAPMRPALDVLPENQAGIGNTAMEQNSAAYTVNDVNLVEESVSMIAAEKSYSANIKTLQTWDEMTQTLLGITQKK